MIVFLVLLFIVAFIIGYLFFAPFYFEINTIDGLYRIRFHRLASVSMKVINNSLTAEIKLAGWKKQIDLFAIEKISKEKPARKKREWRRNQKISWKKTRKILASFKVNKCKISIDFGDMELNGILFPMFYGISAYSGKNIRINFLDENEIILEIENSLARMSWAYISS